MSAMQGVPGWEEVAVGDICEAVNGRAFKSSEWRTTGVPIIRIENLKSQSVGFNYFQGPLDPKHAVSHGDILFAWSGTPGTSFGAHQWRGDRAALNQHIFRIDFDPSRIDAQFLMHALNSNVAGYVAQAHGGVGLGHITKSKFMKSRLPLPPLAEQHRIVAAMESYLTRLDDAVATLERAQRNLKRYRASLLNAAVEGRLVPSEVELARLEGRDYEPASKLIERILAERRRRWEQSGRRGEYEEPAQPDTSALPDLPVGWCWATVSQLTTVVTKGTTPTSAGHTFASQGIRFVKVESLMNMRINPEACAFIGQDAHAALARSQLQASDVLLSIAGTLGRVAVVSECDLPANTNQAVAIARCVIPSMGSYVAWMLRRPAMTKIVERSGRGVGLRNLNLEQVASFCVPLAPECEQQRIVAAVAYAENESERLRNTLESDTRRLARLRQSILKWAFEGKLVDQDPNDESAPVLLERIKAERAAAVPAAKPRRATPRARKTS